ncbi:MAG: flagellar basal body-associated FliL family protein [Lachnospiraceae bacterium]
MKKNLISVLILALVLVNTILTGIMMFTVMPATKKSNELITKVCDAIDLELKGGKQDTTQVSIDDMATYAIADAFTINLKKDANDSKDHYVVMNVSLVMDTTNEDYATYGATIAEKEDMIKSTINQVISGYTYDQFSKDIANEKVQAALTEALQDLYGSGFIIDVKFSSITYQ